MAMKKLIKSGNFPCAKSELRLDITLNCGQSFRWQESSHGVWTSVLAGKVWRLKQNDTSINYEVYDQDRSGSKPEPNILLKSDDKSFSLCPEILYDYFQLHVKVKDLYNDWCSKDENFKSVADKFVGIRVLRQEPVENLFSFICSSNNHISRIASMVEKLCVHYGKKLISLDGKDYYSFPTVDSLAQNGVEENLRHLGFGYRAKYISQSAQYITDNHSADWLISLRQETYEETKVQLMKLCGVGAKVADCVCLMSLDKYGAIPVDTHVYQIAMRYMPHLQKQKSITDALYNRIGNYFRDKWGPYAGWAQSVMFSADLKQFQDLKESNNEKKSNKRPQPKTVNMKSKKKKLK